MFFVQTQIDLIRIPKSFPKVSYVSFKLDCCSIPNRIPFVITVPKIDVNRWDFNATYFMLWCDTGTWERTVFLLRKLKQLCWARVTSLQSRLNWIDSLPETRQFMRIVHSFYTLLWVLKRNLRFLGSNPFTYSISFGFQDLIDFYTTKIFLFLVLISCFKG